MKFTNGYWLMRSNIKQEKACVVYDVKISDNKIILYLPLRPVFHRYDTIDTGIITVEVTAPTTDTFSLDCYHNSGGVDFDNVAFDIKHQMKPIKLLQNDDEKIVFTNENAKIEVFKKDYKMNFYHKDKLLTTSDSSSLGYITDEKNKVPYMKDSLNSQVGECIYGLGERFTSFVKNGQSVDIWNEDGGTGSEQSYKNMPFYISNKNYGLFVNHKGKVSFEIMSEQTTRNQFSVEGERINYILFAADNMKDVIKNFNSLLLGPVATPPLWSFGLWLSTSFTTQYSEEVILGMIDKMIDNDIKISVFHMDTLWMTPFQLCDFEFDNHIGQDPIALIKKIHDRGIKVCFWINSYVSQKSPLFEEAKKLGYLIKRKDGSVWQWDLWQPGNAFVDFTNPDACEWYKSKLKVWLDAGVDCYKTDFGERIPVEDAVFHNNVNPTLEHNYYSYRFNQCVFELLKETRGENEAIVFARSGTFGSQQFPVHWGGDCRTNFESMAESLRGGLSFLSSGFTYWSHDIGGFDGPNDASVYKRWCQFGLLSSHSRLHGNKEYRVPWIFDDEATGILSKFYKLRLEMLPYIYSQAVECSENRLPLMRSMVLEFQNDITTKTLDTQYMFGQNYLVAPIFEESGQVEYFLPEGKWLNVLTQKVYEGNKWYNETYDYTEMPLLLRQNKITATKNVNDSNKFDYKLDSELKIVIAVNGSFEDEFNLYVEGAKKADTFKASSDGKKIIIENSKLKAYKIKITDLVTGKVFEQDCKQGKTEITL